MRSLHQRDRRCPWPRNRFVQGLSAIVVAGIVVLGAPGESEAAIGEYSGKRVVRLELLLENRRITEPELLELVETPVGKPLAAGDVRETIVHLFSLGRFQDVQVDAMLEHDGVALVYRLIPLHGVGRIDFRGDLEISEGTLREAVTDRFGTAPPAGRAVDAARIVEQLYHDRGYLTARVTPQTEVNHVTEQTTLIFDVSPGPRARITRIRIEGHPPIPPPLLLKRLALATGDAYEPANLRQRVARYGESLKSEGYYLARGEVAADVRGNSAVEVVITIEPGPKVALVFEGDPVPREQQDVLVPIKLEGSVDEDLLEDSNRRIKESLNGQGYWKAEVTHRRLESDGQLQVVFTVRRGSRYVTTPVEISGNHGVSREVLGPLITIKPGDPFVDARFSADVAGVHEHYRRLGYDAVHLQAAVNEPAAQAGSGGAPAKVTPSIVITEGPRTVIRKVTFVGNSALPATTLQPLVFAAAGRLFYRPQLTSDRDRLLLEYLNRGYPSATVDVDARFSDDHRAADVIFTVREGPLVRVDHILIVGNNQTDSATIQRELTLQPGAPLGLSHLLESQRRLQALGLFRRVRITELPHPGGAARDLLITVEEAPATTVGYGGGLEAGKRLRRDPAAEGQAVERLEFAPRGFFEIGRRNLWGKNRSIDLYTRISVRPKDQPENPEEDGSGLGFSEYRVLGTFREPRALNLDADLFVTGVLEQAIRSSFNFSRRAANASLTRRVGTQFLLSGHYSLSRVRLFDERFNPQEQLLIDRLFPQVRLSGFSSTLARDTRDDVLDPSRGAVVSIDGEAAARAIGSQVGYTKTFVQGFLYRRLRGTRRVVFAGGVRVGLGRAFPREVAETDSSGKAVVGVTGQPMTNVIEEIPASERFFAGGDTTVRGFALDRLGDEATIDKDGFPKGGNALVIFNTELRVPVWRTVSAVVFLDGGNVFARASDFDISNIRGGAGFGVRYKSPIGPLRVDLGFKLDRRRFTSGGLEPRSALHISIGQAF